MNEFIEAFKNSAYYHLLFDKHDVVLAYLSGSQLVGNTDERSDFDIVVLVKDDIEVEHQSEFLVWNGRKVHWYFRTVSRFIDTPDNVWAMQYVGLMQFIYFNDECIIYQNPDTKAFVDRLKEVKSDISRIGCYQLYGRYKDMIDRLIEANKIDVQERTKMISHLVHASYLLIGDEMDKSAICRIKRMRWQGLKMADEKLAISRLKLLENYIEQNPMDVKARVKEICNIEVTK